MSRRTILAVAAAGMLFAAPALAAGQLELIPDPQMLLILIAGFVVLIFPLDALLFKPVFAALDARAERIQGARTRSTRLDQEADAALERYESAIREARSASESHRQTQLERARSEQAQITAAARAEAEVELDRARQELDRSLEEARVSLRSSAEELADSAASRVLGRAVS